MAPTAMTDVSEMSTTLVVSARVAASMLEVFMATITAASATGLTLSAACPTTPTNAAVGQPGANAADLLYQWFGVAAFVIPFALSVWGWRGLTPAGICCGSRCA